MNKRGENVQVPVLMIDEDWTVDDVETLNDANDAIAILQDSIASIKFQLEVPPREGQTRDETWRARASLALRLKEAALEAVKHIRQELYDRERDRRLLDADHALMRVIRSEIDAQTLDGWQEKARQLYPEAFAR